MPMIAGRRGTAKAVVTSVLARFAEVAEELAGSDAVQVLHASVPPPLPAAKREALLQQVARLSPELKEFYARCDGLRLAWVARGNPHFAQLVAKAKKAHLGRKMSAAQLEGLAGVDGALMVCGMAELVGARAGGSFEFENAECELDEELMDWDTDDLMERVTQKQQRTTKLRRAHRRPPVLAADKIRDFELADSYYPVGATLHGSLYIGEDHGAVVEPMSGVSPMEFLERTLARFASMPARRSPRAPRSLAALLALHAEHHIKWAELLKESQAHQARMQARRKTKAKAKAKAKSMAKTKVKTR